jgi:hypothetical protein
MALALVLGENKSPPECLSVTAACTLDEVEGIPRITTVELTVRARVPGLETAVFERMVEQAADLCPVSAALRGNVEINVRSELASSGDATREPGDPAPTNGYQASPSAPGRQQAEVEDLVRALRGYGALTRAHLFEVCGAAHWPDSVAGRALARGVASGRIRHLGDDLYEAAEPPHDARA